MQYSRIKVGVASVNQIPLAFNHNFNNLIQAIKKAQELNIELLVFPELSLTGYNCEDFFYNQDTLYSSIRYLLKILPFTRNIIIGLGLPIEVEGKLYNSYALLADGKVVGINAKKALAAKGLHYEYRWFTAWQNGEIKILNENINSSLNYFFKQKSFSNSIPFGDNSFQYKSFSIGTEICEEAWSENRLGKFFAEKGIDILINPCASHYEIDKIDTRKRLALEGSRAFSCAYLSSNLLGNEAGRTIYDGDSRICFLNKIVAQTKEFSFNNFELAFTEINKEEITAYKLKNRVNTGHLYNLNHHIKNQDIKINDFFIKNHIDQNSKYLSNDTETNISFLHQRYLYLTQALALGLFDYIRKSKSRGVVISLSGGVDSACVLLLSYLAFSFAFEELGKEYFKKEFFPKEDLDNINLKFILNNLIITIYQATENSSQNTYELAKSLSSDLNVSFYNWDLSTIVKDYENLVSKSLNINLNWEKDDLALQNIQARSRVPALWMVANLKNLLLLTTSNRSELTVGYTTMDGDTCGGFAPISGITKTTLKEWLKWICDYNYHKLSVDTLIKINTSLPTAELKPKEENQTDEKDLMPYPLLRIIEENYIGKRLPKELVLNKIIEEYQGIYNQEQCSLFFQKFLKLYTQNQWKRERAAVGLYVEKLSMDAKYDHRLPVLSNIE